MPKILLILTVTFFLSACSDTEPPDASAVLNNNAGNDNAALMSAETISRAANTPGHFSR